MQDEILGIILKNIRHCATEEEKAALLRWLENSEENRRFYSLFLANYSLHETISSEDLGRNSESMIARLNARIDAAESRRRRTLPRRSFLYAFAALAALVIGFFAVRGPLTNGPGVDEIPMELVANSTQETIHMVLDDGTRVYLRPGAEIRYNVSTLPGSREVNLQGDAYFDVSHNEAKPFIVHTDNIGIRVLGTAFSVSAAPEVSQVVLERGSVRLVSREGVSMVSLSPNQKATYRAVTGDVRVEPVYATAFVTDKYSLMAMSDVTLAQMVSKLSATFHRKISCKGGDTEKHYNLAFLKSDSLEDVLSILEYMTGAECEIE
ncbi:MAG: FecR family protein [Bacteroidales bacterium]|nr:FecR family protein [Bacteroidales bacterium]